MFKFILPEFSGILQSLDWFTVFLGCDSRHCSLKYSFGIFQGCITVYLSRFLLLLFSAATLIEYHMSLPLSTTFLIYFAVQNLSYRTTKLSISPSFTNVNTNFVFICNYLRQLEFHTKKPITSGFLCFIHTSSKYADILFY